MSDGTNTLAPHHTAMLHCSAICDSIIAARGYRTVTDRNVLLGLGFADYQCRVPGLLLPIYTTNGQPGPYVYRPDNPRVQESRKKLPDGTHPSKLLKYEFATGTGVRLDCPPICRDKLGDPATPLWITEGIKKGDALASLGLCAIDLQGVWNFRGKNSHGGLTTLVDWDYVALNGRKVNIVFDSDLRTNSQVRKACERLVQILKHRGAHVAIVFLPPGENGKKMGVDDYLAAGHTREQLEALMEAPPPAPAASPARVELLTAAPPMMRRPLALIDGVGYAAAWLCCRVTTTEMIDRHGNVITLSPPKVTTEQRLFVIRGDGRIFGDGGDAALEDLGLEVVLPEVPPHDKLWRSSAVTNYRQGSRPDPAQVFRRVAEVIDHFLDFNRSLADQQTMAELIACYVLATWFLDAFHVIGFLWPNGEAGCGKTQTLYVICAMGYLGQVILAGGSYATLRDMADYGATLAFDDAENLSSPRLTDPDKRTLLLSGNRRGSTVSVKEPVNGKQWRTRHVNTFCPRLFSAINIPDPVLASRTIVVPLVRTAERAKANSDPADLATWPHDRAALGDDLWALGLAFLPEVGKFETEAIGRARVQGRTLEPWRAILTVALWLESNGVGSLYERMEELSHIYQQERDELEQKSLTVWAIKALVDLCLSEESRDIRDVANIRDVKWVYTPTTICDKVKELLDGDGESTDWVTSRKIGRVMAQLRFQREREAGGNRRRRWGVRGDQLVGLALSYGVISDTANVSGLDHRTPSINVPNVSNAPNGSSPHEPGTADDGKVSDGLRPASVQYVAESVPPSQAAEEQIGFLRRYAHALGCELYGKGWDDARHRHILRLTNDRTQSINHLTHGELSRLISGMNRLRERRMANEAASATI